jgi:hypothetical protein
MLWYKAWLETRWRFTFLIGSILVVWLMLLWLPSLSSVPASRQWVGLQLGSVLLYMFAAIYLAGGGINSQTLYAVTSGFHGSMLFTLSLPVSRRRLLFVRAGLGAILTCSLVVCMAGYILFRRAEPVGALQSLAYIARAVVCTMAVYALSVLLACVLDEMWQFMGACLIWFAVFLLGSRFAPVARFGPIRGMSLSSHPHSSATPWAAVITSAAVCVIFTCSSILILRRKEY